MSLKLDPIPNLIDRIDTSTPETEVALASDQLIEQQAQGAPKPDAPNATIAPLLAPL
jgi:hypothetical protein